MVELRKVVFMLAILSSLYTVFSTADDTQATCDAVPGVWFSGTCTGSNYQCCGDDGALDIFYNGTLTTTNDFCYKGTSTFQTIDYNSTLCDYYSYKTFTGMPTNDTFETYNSGSINGQEGPLGTWAVDAEHTSVLEGVGSSRRLSITHASDSQTTNLTLSNLPISLPLDLSFTITPMQIDGALAVYLGNSDMSKHGAIRFGSNGQIQRYWAGWSDLVAYSADIDYNVTISFLDDATSQVFYINGVRYPEGGGYLITGFPISAADVTLVQFQGDTAGTFKFDNINASWYRNYVSCCGDDTTNDNFYNGTISTTNNFCYQGQYRNQSLDVNRTLCEYYGYGWINVSEGLIESFNFDENTGVYTYGENGTTGTITGAAWTSSGKYGNALSFDGDTDYVAIPDIKPLDFGTSDFTFSTWVKINELTAAATNIFGQRQDGDNQRRVYVTLAGEVDAYLQLGGVIGVRAITSGAGLTTGQWYHVVWVVDRDTSNYVYINGVLQSLGTNTKDNAANNYDFTTSNYFGYFTTSLNGYLDEIKIYKKVFNSSEVGTLYRNTSYFGCCGDDGLTDIFYNGTLSTTSTFCYKGALTLTSLELNTTMCNYFGYVGFPGAISGNATIQGCCGDDNSADDTFYNGTVGTASAFCYQSYYTNNDTLDTNSTLCNQYSYSWINNSGYNMGANIDENFESYPYQGEDFESYFDDEQIRNKGNWSAWTVYKYNNFTAKKVFSNGRWDTKGYIGLDNGTYITPLYTFAYPSPNTPDTTHNYTISFKINVTNPNSVPAFQVRDTTGNARIYFLFHLENRRIYWYSSSGGTFLTGSDHFQVNKEHIVNITIFDTTKCNLTIDGNPINGTLTTYTTFTAPISQMYFYGWTGAKYYIDDIDSSWLGKDIDASSTSWTSELVAPSNFTAKKLYNSTWGFLNWEGNSDSDGVTYTFPQASPTISGQSVKFKINFKKLPSVDYFIATSIWAPVMYFKSDGTILVVNGAGTSTLPVTYTNDTIYNVEFVFHNATHTDYKINDVLYDNSGQHYKNQNGVYFTNEQISTLYFRNWGTNTIKVYLDDIDASWSTSYSCCGDDGTNDNFYNGTLSNTTIFCYQGQYRNQSLDVNRTLCEYYGYNYLSGIIGGNATIQGCCGDDNSTDDTFYNGTLATTSHFCDRGRYVNQSLDENEGVCNRYYSWIPGSITGTGGSCCGDDGSSENFYGGNELFGNKAGNSSKFCYYGYYTNYELDENETLCNYYGYTWVTNTSITYTFDDTPDYQMPSGWTNESTGTAGNYQYVVPEKDGRKKVLKIYDGNFDGISNVYYYLPSAESPSVREVYIEWWAYRECGSTTATYAYVYGTNATTNILALAAQITPFICNKWTHLKLLLNATSDTYSYWIDGSALVTTVNRPWYYYSGNYNLDYFYQFALQNGNGDYGTWYFDDISFSWRTNNTIDMARYASCCGDDGTNEVFYNETIGKTTGLCYKGQNTTHSLDLNQTICEYFNKTWINNTNYLATYSFDNETVGDTDTSIEFVDSLEGGSGVAKIVESIDGHQNVMNLTGLYYVLNNINNAATGTVEFYTWIDHDSSGNYQWYAMIDSNSGDTMQFALYVHAGKYKYAGVSLTDTGVTVLENRWQHHKVIFDCTTDTFNWYVDGTQIVNNGAFADAGDYVDNIRFERMANANLVYIDAIDYSWDTRTANGRDGACCGDDGYGIDETFFNETISTTGHFCYKGQFANKTIDNNSTLSQYYNYTWMTESLSDEDFEVYTENQNLNTGSWSLNVGAGGTSTFTAKTKYDSKRAYLNDNDDANSPFASYTFSSSPTTINGSWIEFDASIEDIGISDSNANLYVVNSGGANAIRINFYNNNGAIEIRYWPNGVHTLLQSGAELNRTYHFKIYMYNTTHHSVQIDDTLYNNNGKYYQNIYELTNPISFKVEGGTTTRNPKMYVDDIDASWTVEAQNGTYYHSCSDDTSLDLFYNGSIGSTNNFCYYGQYKHQGIDLNQTICKNYTYGWVNMSEGLVESFHFDENKGTATFGENGTTGRISGASWNLTGKYRYALSFDGLNDYANFTLGTLNAPFTVSAWCYFNQPQQPADDYDYCLMIGADSTNMISFARNAVNNLFYSYTASTQEFGPALTGNQWIHIVAVYDTVSPYHKLYINGTLQSVDDFSSAVSTSGLLTLGRYNNPTATHYFNGTIDEVKIYNRALTANEIIAEYAGSPYSGCCGDEGSLVNETFYNGTIATTQTFCYNNTFINRTIDQNITICGAYSYGWADKGCCGDDINETFASYLRAYCCRGTAIQEADPCDYNGDNIYEFVNYNGFLRWLKPPKIVAVLVNSSIIDLNQNITVTIRVDNTAGNSTNIPNTTTITANLGTNLEYITSVPMSRNITNSSTVDVELILKGHTRGVSQVTPYINFTFNSKKVVADSAFSVVNISLSRSYVNKYFQNSVMSALVRNIQGTQTPSKGGILVIYKVENSVLSPFYVKTVGDFTGTYNYTIEPVDLKMDCGSYLVELRTKTEGYYSSGAGLLTVTGCYQ